MSGVPEGRGRALNVHPSSYIPLSARHSRPHTTPHPVPSRSTAFPAQDRPFSREPPTSPKEL